MDALELDELLLQNRPIPFAHGVATFGGIATTKASKILRQCLLIGLNAFGSSILPLGTLTENIETIKFGNTTRCLSGCNISPWHGGLTAASAHEEWSWEPVTDTAASAFTDNASGAASSGEPAPGVSSGDLAPEPAPTPIHRLHQPRTPCATRTYSQAMISSPRTTLIGVSPKIRVASIGSLRHGGTSCSRTISSRG